MGTVYIKLSRYCLLRIELNQCSITISIWFKCIKLKLHQVIWGWINSHIFLQFLYRHLTNIQIWNTLSVLCLSLQWHNNERDGVWNYCRLDCLLSRLFRRRSRKTSKLRVTALCERIPPVSDGFPSQRASNAENVFIWRRHHCFVALWPKMAKWAYGI